jgi:hypothetical protein
LDAGKDADTTWIFDADFETTTGDNIGCDDLTDQTEWYAEDQSGVMPIPNYWHLDTLHSYGDSSMWCGRCWPCWALPCGYGNNWIQHLTHRFGDGTEIDSARLDYRQIFAMENDYDYGYVDIRVITTGGDTIDQGTDDEWKKIIYFDNPGFAGMPGVPNMDWESGDPSNRPVLDLTSYVAGESAGWFDIRWRFESDGALSAKDAVDPAAIAAVEDGAWYIDEVKVFVNADTVPIFYDNFEDGEEPGWDHSDFPGENQTGVTFRRAYNPATGRGFSCEIPRESWMMVATHPTTGTLVDYEVAWLQSPAIDISDAQSLIYREDIWFDFPDASNDFCGWHVAASDDPLCLDNWFNYYGDTVYYGGPWWSLSRLYNYDRYVGNDYMRFGWVVGWLISGLPSGGGSGFHMGGLFVDRAALGKIDVPTRPLRSL